MSKVDIQTYFMKLDLILSTKYVRCSQDGKQSQSSLISLENSSSAARVHISDVALQTGTVSFAKK